MPLTVQQGSIDGSDDIQHSNGGAQHAQHSGAVLSLHPAHAPAALHQQTQLLQQLPEGANAEQEAVKESVGQLLPPSLVAGVSNLQEQPAGSDAQPDQDNSPGAAVGLPQAAMSNDEMQLTAESAAQDGGTQECIETQDGIAHQVVSGYLMAQPEEEEGLNRLHLDTNSGVLASGASTTVQAGLF